MTRIRSAWIIPIVLGAALVTTAAAQSPGPPPGPAPQPGQHYGHMGQRLQQRLGLTDTQLKAVQDAFAKQRVAQKPVWTSMRQAQADMRQLALNGADAATIQAKAAEIQQLHAQSLDLRVKTLQEIGPVLTPEQRQKFAEMRTGGHSRGRHHKPPQS